MNDNFKFDIVPYTRGKGIQIMSAESTKLYEHFVGADNEQHNIFMSRIMDFVVADVEIDIEGWFRIIKDNGYMVLLQKESKIDVMSQFKCSVVADRMIEDYHYQVFQKAEQKKTVKPDKTVCVIRYGGFGDMIQASSILPGLKKQGYHVVINTDMAGYDVIKNDPNVDEFLLQDKDQVPNSELGNYWAYLARKYDKLINLSESVEGTLLAIPGRITYSWPKSVRHEMMDVNYLEFTHNLAGVPLPPLQKFYSTTKERTWAQKQIKRINADIIILWTLSGSSVHKAWPYLDTIVARLMLKDPTIKVVLVGDEVSQILEIGWENESRVVKKCGKWNIRETLTFAEIADLVIGPETGVLNAVGRLSVPKIVCLSHSSKENLSKHWNNCISLEPENCPCFPCHQMHYGFNPCPQDHETGVALCQAKISVEQMWKAINKQLEGKL